MNQWKYVKLGEVCTVERGGSPRPIDDFITTDENGINWIKIGDADESMYITKTAQRIKPEGMKKSRYVKPGDFLLSNSMSFGRPYILKIDGCIHDGWLVLRDENNVFDKKFLYYYLSAPITYKKFKSMAVGGVVNNLNSDMVRKVRVPIPSQEEQHRISDRLDKVSNVIFLRNQQLAKLDELVKARFVEMFGEPAANPNRYKKKKLSEIAVYFNGLTYKPENVSDEGMIVLRSSNIQNGKLDFEDVVRVDCAVKEKFVVKENDILMCSRNGSSRLVGKVALIKNVWEPMSFGAFMMIIRSDYYWYLMTYFQMASFREQIKAGTTTTINQITGRMLDSIMIPLPPVDVQNQFATFAERVDQQKQTVQQSLEKLELLKKALMQEYFG